MLEDCHLSRKENIFEEEIVKLFFASAARNEYLKTTALSDVLNS